MKTFTTAIVSAVCLLAISQTCPAAEEDGFKSIFDGKTLEGWDGKEQFWSVEDGAITGRTIKENPN